MTLYKTLEEFKALLLQLPDEPHAIVLKGGFADLAGKAYPIVLVKNHTHYYMHPHPVESRWSYEKGCAEAETIGYRIANVIAGDLESRKDITIDVGKDQIDMEIVTRETQLGYTPGKPLRVDVE